MSQHALADVPAPSAVPRQQRRLRFAFTTFPSGPSRAIFADFPLEVSGPAQPVTSESLLKLRGWNERRGLKGTRVARPESGDVVSYSDWRTHSMGQLDSGGGRRKCQVEKYDRGPAILDCPASIFRPTFPTRSKSVGKARGWI